MFAVGLCGAHILEGAGIKALVGEIVGLPKPVWRISVQDAVIVVEVSVVNRVRQRIGPRHRVADDQIAKIKTMAIMMGQKNATILYDFMILGAYFVVLVMVLAQVASLWALLVFLTLPLGLKNMRVFHSASTGKSGTLAAMDVATAQLHMTFGLLLCISLILARLL